MRAFEIHTFRDGQWKVDSVFDDRELAVHEARKVDENGRYAGVRVIEETYDETSDLTTTRTIFRGKHEKARSNAPKPTAKKISGRVAHRGGAKRAPRGKSRARPQKSKSNGVLVPVLILLLLVISGVAVMFGLHYVSGVK